MKVAARRPLPLANLPGAPDFNFKGYHAVLSFIPTSSFWAVYGLIAENSYLLALNFCVIDPPFDVLQESLAKLCYEWRKNVVSVTSDVIDIKGAASKTYKCKCTQANTLLAIALQYTVKNP